MFKTSINWKRENAISQLMEEWRGMEPGASAESYNGPHQVYEIRPEGSL